MVTPPIKARHPLDRRARQLYHDPDRRSGQDRRAKAAGQLRRPEPNSIGPYAIVLIVTLLLLDLAVWHGYYSRALVAAFDAQALTVRQWGDDLWRM